METFAPPRPFVLHADYRQQREQALAGLDLETIDAPIRGVISALSRLPHCFTLQSCYGHFCHAAQPDLHGLQLLPAHDVGLVQYRIAYVALCIEDSEPGRRLRLLLEQVPGIVPGYIQYGSPDWFWERQINSYALQVEPERFKDKDVATVEHSEALYLQDVRERFFARLGQVAQTSWLEL